MKNLFLLVLMILLSLTMKPQEYQSLNDAVNTMSSTLDTDITRYKNDLAKIDTTKIVVKQKHKPAFVINNYYTYNRSSWDPKPHIQRNIYKRKGEVLMEESMIRYPGATKSYFIYY